MKRAIILFTLFIMVNGFLFAQIGNNISRIDTLYVPKIDTLYVQKIDTVYTQRVDTLVMQGLDTLMINKQDTSRLSFFRQSTDILVTSLFGESRKLDNADSIINQFDALPSFGIYKDNYFIVGSELFKKKNQWNSDAKFQVSIRHRLTNSTLPFKTYLFLTYTQKAFWDVFQESFPFRDLNFNPAVGIGRALVHSNRLLGTLSLQFEHESNGKDGADSRSWNKITFGTTLMFDDNWSLESKLWIPIVDGQENKDIVSKAGWGYLQLDYRSSNRKYMASCVITHRSGGLLNANYKLNFAARIFNDDNQYLFLELYNGYGESMLDYKEHRNRLRLGFVIKPTFFNLF